MTSSPLPARESAGRRWLRRAITVPTFVLLAAALTILSPVLAPLAVLVDIVSRRKLILLRCLAFFIWYLWCEVVGIFLAVLVWGFCGHHRERFLERNFVLQCWWARTLFSGASRIFGLRLEVEGDDVLRRGGFVLFIRHSSVGDTLLPALLVSGRRGIRLRYVLKRELLWDPCLDIVGNRLPNFFLDRGSPESAVELAGVANLAESLGENDAILIYPEGTRFSPKKRQRILERLAERQPELLAAALELKCTLPPRAGGAFALMSRNAAVDAVFCGHSGFDGAANFAELARGALIGRTIRVGFWRIESRVIPRGRIQFTNWLNEEWRRIDRWVQDAQRST